MKVIVTGREGQLARCLADRIPAGASVEFAARPEYDLADAGPLAERIVAERPDVVISAAAYTQVDLAESEAVTAMQVNAEGPRLLAAAARETGALLIHISTDYVFDGTSGAPYTEAAPTAPINAYGRTKLAGEQAIAASGCDFVIARVSWLFSEYGRNFVRTMLRLAVMRDSVSVVDDQRGTPNYAGDIAMAVWRIAGANHSLPVRETLHLANRDVCTWADFAEAIFEASERLGGPWAAVKRVPTSAFPTPASRPANSVLDPSRLDANEGICLPSWRLSLDRVVSRILRDEGQLSGRQEQQSA